MTPYYERDGITLYHADCMDVLPTLELVDLVLTDPPYGVGFAEWDEAIPRPDEWLPRLRVIAPTVLVTPGNGNQWEYPRADWTAAWFRPGSVQRVRAGDGFSHWEPVLIYGKNPLPIDAKQFAASSDTAGIDHPCPKPLKVWQWLISGATDPGDLILDPFAGSGTTGVAAFNLGRRCILIEREEKYCEVAAKRLESLTPPLFTLPAEKPVQASWDTVGGFEWMHTVGHGDLEVLP